MKYILLLSLFVFAFTTEAAYWVVDQNAPARGSVSNLSESQVILMESYLYAKIPDSILLAKENKVCVKKYEKLKNNLLTFDEANKEELSTEETIMAREKIIDRESKNIQVCLKKEGISQKTETKSSSDLSDLEMRIRIIESQIKEIIQALQSMGKMTKLKG